MAAAADRTRETRTTIDPAWHESAINMFAYLAFRNHDVRPLQDELSERGLSSLGRLEQHALFSVSVVLERLHQMAGTESAETLLDRTMIDFDLGQELLDEHTEALLGPEPQGRDVRIMVTMPSESATNYVLVRDMLLGGMDCIRINCAHDDETAWEQMIGNLRRAVSQTGRPCKVFMDLAGPKLRTGAIGPGPPVIRWSPQRDDFGRVVLPARIWLTANDEPHPAPVPADAVLPVIAPWLRDLQPDDLLTFSDTRGARRTLRVLATLDHGVWVSCDDTAYVTTGTEIERKSDPSALPGRFGILPARERHLTLFRGDTLVLTRDEKPGRAAILDDAGRLLSAARIPCTLPEVFAEVKIGERIFFDDGKIGGIISAVNPGEITADITQARVAGSKLRAEKGINLPDSDLTFSALTEKDLQDLPFVAAHADMVGLSFVSRAQDVIELGDRLAELGGGQPGIVLKIETKRAFEHLPELIVAAMRSPSAGLMIARGDLAVECGYDRLAEVQEQILWLAEAAHMPVIWATQVLETLARTGLPSRSEITDAAMGQRAECVMLNKGPHVTEAILLLDSILHRMKRHQRKKRSLLRQLQSWHTYTPDELVD